MPLDLYWHGEMSLIVAYQKAYIRKTSLLAYQVANYMKVGFELAQGNVWGGKGKKYLEMPPYKDPVITETVILSKQDLEEKHRNLMADNMAFLMRKDMSVNEQVFGRES